MGNESPGIYLKTGDEIVTEGVKLPMDFSIQGITDSTLHSLYRRKKACKSPTVST